MNALKSLFGFLGGILLLVGFIFVFSLLVKWGANAAVLALPYVQDISAFILVVCVIVLLPLALFKRTRGFSAIAFVISSFVFGLSLWLSGFLITYAFWGIFGVIVGVLFFGIGVVPTAMIALALHGQWPLFLQFVIGIVMVFGTRAVGYALAAKVDNEAAEQVSNEPVLIENS